MEAEKKTGTKEWAGGNINIISGCANNCIYCYARCMAIRFTRRSGKTPETWQIEELRQENVVKGYSRRSYPIMYPSSHDITMKFIDAHLIVLKKLLVAGNRLIVVSKPRLEVIKILCTELKEYKDKIIFRFTIGSVDDKVLKYWEPGAPSFKERLECLKYAYKKGYQTSVSSEPMLDLRPDKIYQATNRYITESLWFGLLNPFTTKGILTHNLGNNDTEYHRAYAELRQLQDDKFIQELYYQFKDNPLVMWKDKLRDKIILDSKRQLEVAYHEAGHAVVSYILRPGAYNNNLSIIPNKEENYAGCCQTEGDYTMDGSQSKDIIILTFAGYAAQRIFNPKADIRYSSRDTEEALELLQFVKGETEDSLRKQADIIVKENWKSIEILAQYLYEHKVLSSEEWEIILDAINEGEDWKAVISQWYSLWNITPGYKRIEMETSADKKTGVTKKQTTKAKAGNKMVRYVKNKV